MLWPTQKAPKEATSPVPMTTPVNVVALAARTVRRWGVAREGGSDLAGGVLGGDDQDAQDADGELGEEQTAEAERGRVEPQPLRRVEVVPAAHLRGADQGAEADGEPDGGEQRPDRRADRPQLGPLGADVGTEHLQRAGRRGGCRDGGGGDGDGGHAAAPWVVVYSAASRVSSMKASSSDADCGESS